jgi:hypothetical protein
MDTADASGLAHERDRCAVADPDPDHRTFAVRDEGVGAESIGIARVADDADVDAVHLVGLTPGQVHEPAAQVVERSAILVEVEVPVRALAEPQVDGRREPVVT